jgi:hypothetical protein
MAVFQFHLGAHIRFNANPTVVMIQSSIPPAVAFIAAVVRYF